jgi:predicted alpha/beta-fold hydrolase
MISKINLDLPELVPFFNFETGHSQTLLGHIVPTPDFIEKYEIQYVTFADGDQCALKIYRNKNENRKNIVLSVYHGLAGDHRSDYMQRAARTAFDLGWSVVLVDHRGAGLAVGRAKLPYHSGRGDDVSEILQHLKTEFPEFTQVANGYSMSGSILLNLLTGRKGSCQPDYAIVVNAPIDLEQASLGLAKGLSRVYDVRFYQKLRRELKKNHHFKIPLNGYTYNVDDLFTSVKSGFKNKEDYYDQCSTYKYIESVQTPTFILTAQDDPFVLFERYQNLNWPSCVHVTYSKYGGHMGYYSKKEIVMNGVHFKKRWMDLYLYQVFRKIEENISY